MTVKYSLLGLTKSMFSWKGCFRALSNVLTIYRSGERGDRLRRVPGVQTHFCILNHTLLPNHLSHAGTHWHVHMKEEGSLWGSSVVHRGIPELCSVKCQDRESQARPRPLFSLFYVARIKDTNSMWESYINKSTKNSTKSLEKFNQ